MKFSLISALVLMMLVVNTYARSLVPGDVPDPPKRSSSRLMPAVAVPFARAHFTARDRGSLLIKGRGNNKGVVKSSVNSDAKVLPVATAKAPLHILPKTSDQAAPRPKMQPKSSSLLDKETQKRRIIVPAHLKEIMLMAAVRGEGLSQDNDATTLPPPETTTLDAWDAFCKEACEEGKAGPECDCAEHPIGRREAPLAELHLVVQAARSAAGGEPELQHHSIPHHRPRPDQRPHPGQRPRPDHPGSSHPVVPDVKPSDGSGEEEHGDGSSVTTKDPLWEFCAVACKEGQGSLACNCRDHIIG